MFTRKDSLKRHQIAHHASQSITFECDLCKQTFKYRHTLTRHQKSHKRPKQITKNFSCNQCSETFPSVDRLRVHQETRHPLPSTSRGSELSRKRKAEEPESSNAGKRKRTRGEYNNLYHSTTITLHLNYLLSIC